MGKVFFLFLKKSGLQPCRISCQFPAKCTTQIYLKISWIGILIKIWKKDGPTFNTKTDNDNLLLIHTHLKQFVPVKCDIVS